MKMRAKLRWLVLTSVAVSSSAIAYTPFPGQLPVEVIRVNAANQFVINFETWPGFGRRMQVDLPGVAVPSTEPEAAECERRLGAKALELSRRFVKGKKISIKDMEMENSAAPIGSSDLYAGDASLIDALTKKGLARSASIPSTTPWCEDEKE